MNRLHEDRGKEVLAVVVFSPEPQEEVPPKKPPLWILVLYKDNVDFLKESLFLRERDPSGMFHFFPYPIEGFKEMVKDSHPIAYAALKTGFVIHELQQCLEDIVQG